MNNTNIILSSFTLEELRTVLQNCIKTELQTSTPPPPPEENFIDENQAKIITGLSKVSLKKFRDLGKIKYYRIGSRIRYKRSDLLEALETRKKYGRTAK